MCHVSDSTVVCATSCQDVNLEYSRLKTKASSHGLVLEHDGTLADSDSGGESDGAGAAAMMAEQEVELAAARTDAEAKADQLAGLQHELSQAMLDAAAAAEKHQEDAAVSAACRCRCSLAFTAT